MSDWEIQWGSKRVPVEMMKRTATDSHGELPVYMVECLSPASPGVLVRGFGLDEDQAILDLYRDIHRRVT